MRKSLLISAALFLGCGIPGDTIISELDNDQWETICADIAEPVEERHVDCGDFEVEQDGMSADEAFDLCMDWYAGGSFTDDCAGTVDDLYACTDGDDELTDDQICGEEDIPEPPAACERVGECFSLE